MHSNTQITIEDANLLLSLSKLTSDTQLIDKYISQASSMAMDVGYSCYYLKTVHCFDDEVLINAFDFGYMEAARATSFENWIEACENDLEDLQTVAGELIVYIHPESSRVCSPFLPKSHMKIKDLAKHIANATSCESNSVEAWSNEYTVNVLTVADNLSEIEAETLLIFSGYLETDSTELRKLSNAHDVFDNEILLTPIN